MKQLKKEDINYLLNALSKQIKKNFKGMTVEVTIVGGASILLNYDFRSFTYDIDIVKVKGLHLKDIGSKIVEGTDIRPDWLNDSFMYSKSYTPQIYKFREYYRSFNHVLDVYTVRGIYLLCMKMISFRKGSDDLTDINGLIDLLPAGANMGTIEKTLIEMYGTVDIVSDDAYVYVANQLQNAYDDIEDLDCF